MAWKYVVFSVSTGSITWEFPVIFPDKLVHKDVVDCLETILPGREHRVVAAGFIDMMVVGACGGESETLGNIESRGKTDKSLIESFPYFHGVV